MKTKKVTRHYCDHCSKGMFQKPAMERHERVCYRNPSRTCPMCGSNPDYAIAWQEKLKTSKDIDIDGTKSVETTKAECPECLLSLVIRNNTGTNFPWVQYDKDLLEADRRYFRSEFIGGPYCE